MTKSILVFIAFFSLQTLFAQVPTISSFTPKSGRVDSTVTITGTGFSEIPANNIVYVGGVKATVSAATSTTLAVTVPSGTRYQPITVTTNNLTAYSSLPYITTFSGGGVIDLNSFSSKVDFIPGSNPRSISSADLNGDGKADIVVTNQGSATISVFKNTSTSGILSFDPKVDFETGPDPFSLFTGDFDGDGMLDLAITNFNSGNTSTVSILRNTSSGGLISFAPKEDFSTGNGTIGVSIDDFDGDGKPDLLVGSGNSGMISIFKNTSASAGSISFASRMDIMTITHSDHVSIGDLDGDGKPDIVFSVFSNQLVSIYRNTSSGGVISFDSDGDYSRGFYSSGICYSTGSNPENIAIGDLDDDGKPDITIPNYGSNTVSVFRNTGSSGNISFDAKIDFTTGNNPTRVSIGDLDGDGKLDLAVTNGQSNTVSVFKNLCTTGNISFASKVNYITAMEPTSVSIGDLDGDSKPDIAITNGTSGSISVLRNIIYKPTITSFTPVSGVIGSTVTIKGTGFSVTPTDNIVYFGGVRAEVTAATETFLVVKVPIGAGYQPITVTTNHLTGYSTQQFNVTFAGTGTINSESFIKTVQYDVTGSSYFSGSTADFDCDGKLDIISVNYSGKSVSVFKNTSTVGTISFADKIDSETESNPGAIAIGDLDGDGMLDFAITNDVSRIVSVYRNISTPGTILFADRTNYSAGTYPVDISISDIDEDGKPDLIIANSQEAKVSILKNSGTVGTISFDNRIDFSTGSGSNSLSVGDFNNDRKPDIAVTNYISNTLSIIKNTSTIGTISFADKVDFSTNIKPLYISNGDINGDGKLDLIISCFNLNEITVMQNTSSEANISFSPNIIDIGSSSNLISVGDLDGDGKPDLALPGSALEVYVLKNTETSGSISFASKVGFSMSGSSNYVSINDLDGDGKPDMVVSAIGSISILRNTNNEPTITAFMPTSISKGGLVTISGTNFVNASSVSFGGITASSFSVISPTSITAVVGDGASGEVSVITPGGIAKLAGFTYTISAGVDDNNSNKELTVYPNPSKGFYHISSNEKIKSIVVMDILGNEVMSYQPQTDKTLIDLTKQPEGIYFMVLNFSNQVKTMRVIKQ